MSFSTAKAQLLPVHPITQNELPSEVYSLLQDHRGQLWFSSDHGLYEYDGYDFKVWT
ncbi:MAG: two-component regulator propeller domain-containing protein, partial [Salibacteraceae bacterium]